MANGKRANTKNRRQAQNVGSKGPAQLSDVLPLPETAVSRADRNLLH